MVDPRSFARLKECDVRTRSLRNLRLSGLCLCLLSMSTAIAEDDVDRRSGSRSYGQTSGLPRPSSMSTAAFEKELLAFLRGQEYKRLGWHVDKSVRDTGPYIRRWNYGTHHTVRIFYSPEVMRWLDGDRQGDLPDGAMMVKEQFGMQPAISHHGKTEDEIWDALKAWTIMIKDSQGSYDGWYWANPAKDPAKHEMLDNHVHPFNHKDAGFGLYCIRCHAVTSSPANRQEYTFASLRNIKGHPGHPVLFRVDNSWQIKNKEEAEEADPIGAHTRCTNPIDPSVCPTRRNPEFLELFPTIPELHAHDVREIPPVTHDRVVRVPPERAASQAFVTSNQCMSCHAGLLGEFGPVMFRHTEDPSQYKNGTSEYAGGGIDFSPYGEWRWSPMGLAGRDPIFFAQLETELAILAEEFSHDPEKQTLISEKLVHTCLRCHGAMGKHQFDLDQQAAGNQGNHFTIDHVFAHNHVDEIQTSEHQYGALARDGISCTICHRMQARQKPADDDRPYLQYFLETSITGNFHLGPPNELYGPYKEDEISAYPMEHGIGFKPKHSEYISSSQMCGTCHTVNLPIVDFPYHEGEKPNELARAESVPEFRKFHHHVEQATYLEWLNSEYENEFDEDNPKAQSCQDCHMSKGLRSLEHGIDIEKIQTQVAIIQDTGYPDAENLVAHEEMSVRVRDEYSRHNFSGLNMFLVEMFNQFDAVLGVRKVDYMTGTEQIPHAKDNFLLTASEKTAEIEVKPKLVSEGTVSASVLVKSKVGHRFPSGVGFRRAFLEVVAVDRSKTGDQAIIWGSGRTNSLGVIVDGNGQQLETEFFSLNHAGEEQYQPHHTVIDSEDQVQIYETLLFNKSGKFTTSFIHGCDTIKDNRLLPRGWSKEGPNPSALNGLFLAATFPVGAALDDPLYMTGRGADETTYRIPLPKGTNPKDVAVKATLYYQAIPPYFLKTIFDTAPHSDSARRLHYICSNLDLQGTPIEDWKLKVVSDEAPVSH